MVRDNSDRMVELLEAIALRTGASPEAINIDRSQNIGVSRELSQGYIIQETADMDDNYVNEDGSAHFEAGDQHAIVRYDVKGSNKVRLYGVGASDHSNMLYILRADDQYYYGGWTNSPLGTLNDEFSFIEKLDTYIEANESIEYIGWYDAPQGSSVDAVGRLHLEVVPE